MRFFDDVDEFVKTKLFMVELLKDSPLVLYVAFQEPLHLYLATIAEEWNPILQFILNIIAFIWGIARLIPIFKGWFGDGGGGDSIKTDDFK